jgi:hypothetical protein
LFETSFRIDATEECGDPGRVINNSARQYVNLAPFAMEIDSVPRLFFRATCDIPAGKQLFYHYADNRKVIKESCPWMFNDASLTEGKAFIT